MPCSLCIAIYIMGRPDGLQERPDYAGEGFMSGDHIHAACPWVAEHAGEILPCHCAPHHQEHGRCAYSMLQRRRPQLHRVSIQAAVLNMNYVLVGPGVHRQREVRISIRNKWLKGALRISTENGYHQVHTTQVLEGI